MGYVPPEPPMPLNLDRFGMPKDFATYMWVVYGQRVSDQSPSPSGAAVSTAAGPAVHLAQSGHALMPSSGHRPRGDAAPRHRRFGFNPDWVVHPGETLREWREENHLPTSAAAVSCARMPLDLYRAIEAGTAPIDDTVAAGLAHGTGIPATLWLNLERIFRAGLAEGKTWTR